MSTAPTTLTRAVPTARWSTPDLCDKHGDVLRVLPPDFTDFGGREAFCGPVVTVACFEDNSRVKELAAEPGHGRVLVVNGGGSLRRALLGDQIALRAADNGWSGMVINGAVRDVEILRTVDLGVRALGAAPRRTDRRGFGAVDVQVTIGAITVRAGDHLYADASGIVVAPRPVH